MSARRASVRLNSPIWGAQPGDELEVNYGPGVSAVMAHHAELIEVTRDGKIIHDDPANQYIGRSLKRKKLTRAPRDKMARASMSEKK